MDIRTVLFTILNIITCAYAVDEEDTVKLAVGASGTMDCVVPGLSATQVFLEGKATVNWKKYQPYDGVANPTGLDLNDGVRVSNDLPEVFNPHIDVAASSTGDELPFSLQLTLKDVELEDSGKYVCEVDLETGGKHTYTYFVQVIDAIDEVLIYSVLDAAMVEAKPNTTSWSHQPEVTLGTRTSPYLACVARGGYPLPTIQMDVDGRPITGLMKLNDQSYTLSGVVEYRQRYNTWRLLASNNYPVDVSEDGATIRCVAKIENEDGTEMSKKEITSKLVASSKPSFQNCSTTMKTAIGTENFQIKCEFLAKPSSVSLEWRAETTGEIIKRVDGANGDFTASMNKLEGDHRFEAVLTIGMVDAIDFQPYTVSASNSQGKSDMTITLVEGEEAGVTGRAAILSAASTIFTIFAAILLSVSL